MVIFEMHRTLSSMSPLSIRLPNSIHQHAKRVKREEGVSVNQLVNSALGKR